MTNGPMRRSKHGISFVHLRRGLESNTLVFRCVSLRVSLALSWNKVAKTLVKYKISMRRYYPTPLQVVIHDSLRLPLYSMFLSRKVGCLIRRRRSIIVWCMISKCVFMHVTPLLTSSLKETIPTTRASLIAL